MDWPVPWPNLGAAGCNLEDTDQRDQIACALSSRSARTGIGNRRTGFCIIPGTRRGTFSAWGECG